MDTRYSFAVLRYVHDVVSGEFANVGIVFYAPDAKFLASRCIDSYRRLSAFFPGLEGAHVRRILRFVESHIEMLSKRIETELVLKESASEFETLLGEIIPKDDSALQFSSVRGGLTRNPASAFEALFKRYIADKTAEVQRATRSDDDVLRVFRRSLTERRVIDRLQTKKIVGKDYDHEFPIAWKNGVWHTSEAVSFDLQDPVEMLEKANRWLGRAHSLLESGEQFKLHLLIGAPKNQQLVRQFNHAKNILHKMPLEHQLVAEDEAASFADFVARDLEDHARHSKE